MIDDLVMNEQMPTTFWKKCKEWTRLLTVWSQHLTFFSQLNWIASHQSITEQKICILVFSLKKCWLFPFIIKWPRSCLHILSFRFHVCDSFLSQNVSYKSDKKETDFKNLNIFESVKGVSLNIISWYRIRMKVALQICTRTDNIVNIQSDCFKF